MKIYTKDYPSISGVEKTETKLLGELIDNEFTSRLTCNQVMDAIYLADRLVEDRGKAISKEWLRNILMQRSTLFIYIIESKKPIPEMKTFGEKILLENINKTQKGIDNNNDIINKANAIIEKRCSETEIMIRSLYPYFERIKEAKEKIASLKQDLATIQKNK